MSLLRPPYNSMGHPGVGGDGVPVCFGSVTVSASVTGSATGSRSIGYGPLENRGVKLLPLSPLLLGLDIDQWEWDLDHLRVDPQPAPKKKKL